MLLIPKSWLPLAEADIPAETLGCLGVSVAGLPPVVAGVLPLIELAEARWFIDPSRREPLEAARALYIIAHRRGALADVRAYEAGETEKLDKAASAWIADHPEITADLAAIHRLMIAPIATGFSLLPSNGGIDGEWWFGSEWLGGIVAAACRMGLGTWDAVLWDIPFTMIGHAIAGKARQEDVKGVGRRLDEDAVDREIAAAEEREKRGELHPWQIADPASYSPSEEQIKARPAILAEYERILAEKAEKAEKERA